MENETLVYDEWDHILVPAPGHGGAFYRVFYGSVSWTRKIEDMVAAVVVFMQNDGTEDFQEAKSRGVIQWHLPAHILVADLPRVTQAIQTLSERNHK
jgi:hypothetical protein